MKAEPQALASQGKRGSLEHAQKRQQPQDVARQHPKSLLTARIAALDPSQLIALQSVAGNEAVTSLLQVQRDDAGPAPPATAPAPAPAPPASAPAAGYAWHDPNLKKLVDDLKTTAEVVAYVNGLSTADQRAATNDLEKGRLDYVTRSQSEDAITLMDRVLQGIYAKEAKGKSPAALMAGTHEPSAAEKELLRGAMVPPRRVDPVTHAAAPFHSEIIDPVVGIPLDYETRMTSRVEFWIKQSVASLVKDRGPAEHADAAQVNPMSRFTEIGKAAQQEVDQVFGHLKKGPGFVAGVNLFDQFEAETKRNVHRSPAQKKQVAEDLVEYALVSDKKIVKINHDHDAVPERSTVSPGETESETTILKRVTDQAVAKHEAELLDIERGWEGEAGGGIVFLQRFKPPTDDPEATKQRQVFWDNFQIMIHEYLHTLTHNNYEHFAESFPPKGHSPQFNTLIEGMTSALTEVAWADIEPRAPTDALRKKVEGTDLSAKPFLAETVPDISNRRYDSFDQAMAVIATVGIDNVMAAYFLGKTNLIKAAAGAP